MTFKWRHLKTFLITKSCSKVNRNLFKIVWNAKNFFFLFIQTNLKNRDIRLFHLYFLSNFFSTSVSQKKWNFTSGLFITYLHQLFFIILHSCVVNQKYWRVKFIDKKTSLMHVMLVVTIFSAYFDFFSHPPNFHPPRVYTNIFCTIRSERYQRWYAIDNFCLFISP